MKGLHLGYHATQDSMGGRGAYLPNAPTPDDTSNNPIDEAATNEFGLDAIDARINNIINGENSNITSTPTTTEQIALRPATVSTADNVPDREAHLPAPLPNQKTHPNTASTSKKKSNTKFIVDNSLSPEELRAIRFGAESREKP